MTSSERQELKDYILFRVDKGLHMLDGNAEYQSYECKKNLLEHEVEEILQKLNGDDAKKIKQYSNYAFYRNNYEMYSAYFQGIQDCISGMVMIGLLGRPADI